MRSQAAEINHLSHEFTSKKMIKKVQAQDHPYSSETHGCIPVINQKVMPSFCQMPADNSPAVSLLGLREPWPKGLTSHFLLSFKP